MHILNVKDLERATINENHKNIEKKKLENIINKWN